MNYRVAQLLAPEDLEGSGTKVIDVDLDQPISEIEIRFQTTKGSEAMSAPGPANISKIELVDGSNKLHSLTGYENQALAYYNRPGIAMEHGQYISGLSQVDLYLLTFGRHLWDEELAFLPGNFRNPQLRITWDEDVSDTSVTVNECEVLARIFDEKQIAPIGFLRAIEEYDYTLGSDNSYESINLPTDHVIRQMLVRAYQDGYEPWYSIDEARLDENGLQRIPWEYTNLEQYYRMMKAVTPAIQVPSIVNLSTSARTFYYPVTDFWATVQLIASYSQDVGPYINSTSMRGGKASLIGVGTGHCSGHCFGYLPWHCYQFPMGLQDRIEDWYNPEGKAPRLRLRASTGATSSTGQVVLEQLHRY